MLHLEQLVLQRHVVLWLETDAGAEDVGQSTSLLSKSIDDWGSRRSQWSLEHVAEDREHAVEVSEVLGGSAVSGVGLPLDAGHHLSNQDEIDDQRGCKQGVLADVEETRTCY
jgi:hypothetical protein